MPPDRNITHSGPFIRNQLLGTNQYAAATGFPKFGKWDRTTFDDSYVVKGSVARTMPVDITLVCDLSSDSHFLQPQGTYNPKFMPSPEAVGRKTKLQFTVQRPSTDHELGEDYDKGVRVLLDVQSEVAKTQDRRHLIVGEQLRLNYNLFEPKDQTEIDNEKKGVSTSGGSDDCDEDSGSDTMETVDSGAENSEDEDDEMHEGDEVPVASTKKPKVSLYEVPSHLQEMWREVEKSFRNRYMPVYGLDKNLVPYTDFPKVLRPGTTILVSFNLIHYTIKEDRSKGFEAFDSFVGSVKEITILNLHDSGPARSPSTPKRKGRIVSQTPPTRGTLRLSADTFSPVSQSPLPTSSTTRPGKDKHKERRPSVEPSRDQSVALVSHNASDSPASPPPPTASDPLNIAAAIARAIPAGVVVNEDLIRDLLPLVADYFQKPQIVGSNISDTIREYSPVAGPAVGPSASQPVQGASASSGAAASSTELGPSGDVLVPRVTDANPTFSLNAEDEYVHVDAESVLSPTEKVSSATSTSGGDVPTFSAPDSGNISGGSNLRDTPGKREPRRRK